MTFTQAPNQQAPPTPSAPSVLHDYVVLPAAAYRRRAAQLSLARRCEAGALVLHALLFGMTRLLRHQAAKARRP